MSWQLRNFDSENFIRQYWQKKPCLIRQALVDFKSPITPEELAGLACEDEVHSRLVIEKDGATAWQLKYGPFDEKTFQTLPESNYSLLVSECEKWIPEFTNLLDQFHFIPVWRIDDLMLSYAPGGGSVGPHCDEYDVFLLQADGCRKWQYTDERVDHPALIPDLDLSIMSDFSFDQEAILAPGDMLYLPPGIAHYGVAMGPCLTISIGFRAPTASEVLESLLLEIDQQNLGTKRYADPMLETKRHPSEICDAEIDRFKALALSLLDQPDSLWRDTVGKLLSDTGFVDQHRSKHATSLDEIIKHRWIVNLDCKMLYHRGNSIVKLYCNGHAFELPNSEQAIEYLRDLCENRCLTSKFIDACHGNESFKNLICELVAIEALIPSDE